MRQCPLACVVCRLIVINAASCNSGSVLLFEALQHTDEGGMDVMLAVKPQGWHTEAAKSVT